MTTSATMTTMVMTITVRAVFFMRKHVEMSSGPNPGATFIVWAIQTHRLDEPVPSSRKSRTPS